MGLTSIQRGLARANLYKMLLYETGGHFRKHRDTEKEPGMFGTLVIQLPSKHEGGGLVIYHAKETKTFEFSADSEDERYLTAFYADCEHEFLPVTSGYRLCLVYNLVLNQPPPSASLPSSNGLAQQVIRLREIAKECPQSEEINCIVHGYLLEHKYTTTNLRFRNLKGRDKHVADCLRQTTDADGNTLFGVSLMLLEKYEYGEASGDSYSYYSRRYDDEDEDEESCDHQMDEVIESRIDPCLWIGPIDEPMKNFGLKFDVEQLLGDEIEEDDLFEGSEPDQKDYEAYTGNAGPTLQYWYFKSVLVFWSKKSSIEVAAQAGFDFLLASLASCQPGSSEVEIYGEKILNMVVEKKVPLSVAGLKAFAHAADEKLTIRAIEKVVMVYEEAFFDTIIGILNRYRSEAIDTSILKMIERGISPTVANKFRSNVTLAIRLSQRIGQSKYRELETKAREVILERLSDSMTILCSDKSVVQELVSIVVHSDEVLEKFVDAVLESSHSIAPVLNRLMENFHYHPMVKRLAAARVAKLQKSTRTGRPVFSWQQPKASFPGSLAVQVNHFLHGPTETKTFRGFNGVSHARNWASKYFGYRNSGYSARAVSGGRGVDAYVTVSKTRDVFNEAVRQYEANVAELEKLGSVFGKDMLEASAEKRPAEVTNTGTAEKKAKPNDIRAQTAGSPENPIVL